MPLQSVLGGLGLRGACGRLLGACSGRGADKGLGFGLGLSFDLQPGFFLLACKSESGD